MQILLKPINTVTFQNVVDFCKEGYIEGIQLEYKNELPKKGLAKSFAAFSNSRGGIIIIGVEENERGRPEKYEGIEYDSKLVDQIHQYSTSVIPRPSYEVHCTNEVGGKMFILIRIYEGDETPYCVFNDSNFYIRTGNITDPIGLAKPEAVELMVGKKDKARIARNNYIKMAEENFLAGIKMEEKRHSGLLDQKLNSQVTVPHGTLLNDKSMLTILAQPFFPHAALCQPKFILDNVQNIRASSALSFPSLSVFPVQQGVFYISSGTNGFLSCHQVFSSGLMFFSDNVRTSGGDNTIEISTIALNIKLFLVALQKFYSLTNYQDHITGYVKLDNINGAKVNPISTAKSISFQVPKAPLLNEYFWDIEIDHSQLLDLDNQNLFIRNKMQEIYWSFGYENVSDDLLREYLDELKLDQPINA